MDCYSSGEVRLPGPRQTAFWGLLLSAPQTHMSSSWNWGTLYSCSQSDWIENVEGKENGETFCLFGS